MKLALNQKNGEVESLCIGEKELIHFSQHLFRLSFMDEKGIRHDVCSSDCFKIEYHQRQHVITIFYRGFPNFPELCAEITIRQLSEEIAFGISLENNTGMHLETLQYPCLNLKDDLKGSGGEGAIFLPYCEGVVCYQLDDNGDEKHYPGLINMQFMSYYDHQKGLYFACEDTACTPKIIDCKPKNEGLDMIIQSFIAVAPGECYSKEDYSVLREFSGDWQDACELYRSFTERSRFSLPKKNSSWQEAPKWYEEAPLIVIYPVRSVVGIDYFGPNEYFPYMNGKKYLDELKQEVDHCVLALLVNWEGSAPWCPPFIWPPYGGEDELRSFVEAMHQNGDYVGLYASGINWTDQSVFCPEYDMTEYRKSHGIDQMLCTKPDGSLDEERCVNSVRSGYHMCPACEWTKQITQEQIEGIADCEIDYLQYFDQNLGGASDLCYSRNHPHPPVHGPWAVDEMKDLYRRIETIFEQKDCQCLIGAESSPSDCFLAELKTNDLRYQWPMAESSFTGILEGIAVPAFQFVFHEYTMNFMGNQCSFENSFPGKQNPTSLNFRLAYSFVAGDMLTVVLKSGGEIHYNWGAKWIKPGPNQLETKAFLKELYAMRRGLGRNYLQYGRMEKNIELICDTVSFTGSQKTITYPAVLSSRWSSETGEKAVILVNHTNHPQKVILSGRFKNCFNSKEVLPPPQNECLWLEPFEVIGLTEIS